MYSEIKGRRGEGLQFERLSENFQNLIIDSHNLFARPFHIKAFRPFKGKYVPALGKEIFGIHRIVFFRQVGFNVIFEGFNLFLACCIRRLVEGPNKQTANSNQNNGQCRDNSRFHCLCHDNFSLFDFILTNIFLKKIDFCRYNKNHRRRNEQRDLLNAFFCRLKSR